MRVSTLLDRLRWRGPLLTTQGEPEHRRAMALGAVYLYSAGGMLALLAVPLLGLEGGKALPMGGIALTALAGALAHLVIFDRMLTWVFHFSALTGTTMISLTVAIAGEAGPAYAFVYVWIVLYAFFFYRLREAVLHAATVGAAATTMLLPGLGPLGWVSTFVLVAATLAVAGSLVLVVKGRLRRLFDGLRESEQKYRDLVERLPLVTYLDRIDATSSNLYSSPQTEAMLGYPPERWSADPDMFLRVLHPDDRDWVLALHERVQATGEPLAAEYRLLAADGRYVWVRDEAVVVPDDDGRPLHLQGFLVDVTERKQLEEQLRHSQKMEAVGRLAGGIAHDFNNLLTAIEGYAELALLKLGGANASAAESIERSRDAVRRAAALTNQLLAFSRRQVVRSQPVDLNALVHDTSVLLRRLIPENIELRFRASREPLVVRADRSQLDQVLVNLAVNARDAMPEGGVLTIETAEEGDSAVLVVTDTGVGMDDTVRTRLFEPFFTTKEEGTGLGLATAYGIVEQSGGDIAVASEPGGGSVFTVRFPLVTETAEPEPVEPGAPVAGGSEQVLLVEDEDIVRVVAREALEANGYAVVDAGGGLEALEAFERAPTKPAVVVTDVVMPGMNGRELAEALRERDPGLPVLFVSGHANQLLGDADLGAHTAFLAKPFSLAALAEAVRDLLDERAPATA